MTKYTIKDCKRWLKKKYPHLYYSENTNFAADNTPITLEQFEDFKREMNKVGSMSWKAVKSDG